MRTAFGYFISVIAMVCIAFGLMYLRDEAFGQFFLMFALAGYYIYTVLRYHSGEDK